MVRAQNDLFMVVQDSQSNSMGDNSMEYLQSGRTTRGEFQRSAANICRVLMRSPVMDRYLERMDQDDLEVIGEDTDGAGVGADCVYYEISGDTVIDMSHVSTELGHSEVFGITVNDMGIYDISAKMRAGQNVADLAQMSISVFYDNQLKGIFTINGTNKEWTEQAMDLGVIFGKNHYIKLFFSMSGMELEHIRLKKTGNVDFPF